MRFLLTIMLTLFLFTANVVETAFDHCDDPSCSQFMGGVQKKSDSEKKTSGLVHCAAGCHQVVAMPSNNALASRHVLSVTSFWSEHTMLESFFPESLIEPPSLA